MYEHKSEPLAPFRTFLRRVARHGLIALAVVIVSLVLGILGYHFLEGLGWIDAIVNAAMILGGMGPVNELRTDAGKLFAAAYALFSGIIFLVTAGILFAPVLHRFIHKFHLDESKR
ncbi:MAG TPA: hypothetical protein VIS48_15085 [Candidatus Kryptonia bacterium]